MFFPNKAQWCVIWSAAIVLFTNADYHFFPLLGDYAGNDFYGGGRWLWPSAVGFGSHQHTRLVVSVIVAALLLIWRFTRPVRIKSDVLIPLVFVVLCLAWYAIGAIRHSREPTLIVTPEQYNGR